MNSNEFIQSRLEKIKNQLNHLPVPEDMESVSKSLAIFESMVKDLQVVHWVMYVRHKMSLLKNLEDSGGRHEQ